MYTQLTQLSLLQGMNATDLTQIQKLAQIFHIKGKERIQLCRQGEVCTTLMLLLKGKLQRRYITKDRTFEFEEELPAPWVLEPESLYGLHCTFSSNYYALENSSLFTLSKQEMAHLFTKNEIFRMNYLNILSAALQHQRENLLQPYTSLPEKRLSHLIQALSIHNCGPKTLRIKMEDLALYIHETRLHVSRILNKWQDKNLVKLQRKEIHVYSLESLIQHINSISI